jgi:hypothetical protein
MGLQDSAWVGGIYGNFAESGEPVGRQEELYAIAKPRLTIFPPSVQKTVVFWGGYNMSAADMDDETARRAIVDRYLAMAEDAAQNGMSSVHWSKLRGESSTTVAEHDDWNEYYENGCVALQAMYPDVNIIFYDHRLTFDNSEFDGPTRNPDFFVDSRHLSELGQATLVADFVARFPALDQQWDQDAANYIARIIQKGATVTTAQREEINAWYLAEKAAGTYSSRVDFYMPIWGNEDANRVNLITGQMDATVVDDVIHGDGFVQSDTSGTLGYFALGHSPTDIGMTNASTRYTYLIMEAPGSNESLLGARNTVNQQQRINTNTLQYPLFATGANVVSQNNSATAGLYSGSKLGDEQFLARRNSGGRTVLSAGSATPSGTVSTFEIFAMCSNISGTASGIHAKPTGFWGCGMGLTDADDAGATLREKNLWESLTSQTIPA